jgi:putative Mg2+ transporter-C (MgtC) family protein
MPHVFLPLDQRAVEVVFRLLPALVCGGVIGLNRDLRGKPVGFRTLSLVGMGSALITWVGVTTAGTNDGSVSRVFQGLITGIGFLGAGVILQPGLDEKVREVRGLTTAACVWVVACIGAASGVGMQVEAVIVTLLVLAVLSTGGWIERRVERVVRRRGGNGSGAPPRLPD